MNKFGMVLGVAAVATLAGCKDPDYVRGNPSQHAPKTVAPAPIEIEPAPLAKCKCAPGTKHTSPCNCGATDCACIVEIKPIATVDLSKPTPASVVAPSAPEFTIYVVQSGDYLAKISKKFNVTIAAIKRANPSIKKDVVRVGQKLKIPGKVDVGAAAAPVATSVVPATTGKKTAYAPYTGATKEYVVKSGDTLGAIAYGNGINIPQLKELNGLTKDTVWVGQKLKIPAEKVVRTDKVVKAAAKASVPAAAKTAAAPAKVEEKVKAEESAVVAAVPTATQVAETTEMGVDSASAEETKAEAPAAITYVVQEGDDMTGLSVRFGVPGAVIRELNNMNANDQLAPGQIIKLPADAAQQQ